MCPKLWSLELGRWRAPLAQGSPARGVVLNRAEAPPVGLGRSGVCFRALSVWAFTGARCQPGAAGDPKRAGCACLFRWCLVAFFELVTGFGPPELRPLYAIELQRDLNRIEEG